MDLLEAIGFHACSALRMPRTKNRACGCRAQESEATAAANKKPR